MLSNLYDDLMPMKKAVDHLKEHLKSLRPKVPEGSDAG